MSMANPSHKSIAIAGLLIVLIVAATVVYVVMTSESQCAPGERANDTARLGQIVCTDPSP